MRMQSEMAKAPVVSAANQGQVLENFMDESVAQPAQSLAATKAAIKQQMAQGQVQTGAAPEKKTQAA